MLSHKRDHYCGLLTEEMAGQKVHLSGWVQRTRDLGGVVFVWLRDREGLVQLVFDNSVCSQEIFDLGRSLRSEYVVTVLGTVKKEEYNEAVAELQKLPEKMEQFLASESCEAIPKYASQYFNHNSVFFIGRNRRKRAGAPEVPLPRPAPHVDAEQASYAQQSCQLHSL